MFKHGTPCRKNAYYGVTTRKGGHILATVKLPEIKNNGGGNSSCPQLPGTVLRIFIPPGAVINLLNLIEISSPGGICLIIRIPLLAGGGGALSLDSIVAAIKQAGGTVEFV